MRILKECKPQIQEYFPTKTLVAQEVVPSQNIWTVINCHIDELEGRLKQLSVGKKQIMMSRYEDQVTVIIKELDQ
jgi:hypothetical protein